LSTKLRIQAAEHPLEHAQQMAGHESSRTTKLYDRTKDEITQSEVARVRLVTFDPKLRYPDRVTRVSGDVSDVFRAAIEISFVRSFRGSIYAGHMTTQPPVRVMKKEPDVYEVEVAAARPTLHCVTAGVGDVECLTGGKANAERLIEESFRFLLELESNTSILRSFRITDISSYFPEYEREIRRRLAR
jgi:hypothetical protein